MDGKRANEIWILGATGNVGRGLAGRLAAACTPGVVLVGRSAERLASVADSLGAPVRTRQLAGFAEMLAAVQREQPLVIVNATGDATPHDVLTLEQRVIETVRARFGVELHPEVEHL